MIEALERVLVDEKPDVVLLYGDTNSTLAGAIAAAKLHLCVAHLEAGLRSRNSRMPEEHNRVLTDHSSDLCLAPTSAAVSNLEAEGLGDKTVLVGDIMADVCLETYRQVSGRAKSGIRFKESERSGYLATIHRADNTDNQPTLEAILEELSNLDEVVTLPAHPRLLARLASFGIEVDPSRIRIVQPLDYPSMIEAVSKARSVITDSGGLQKECFLLATPCVTVRGETEWIETVELGWNVLAEPSGIREALYKLDPRETSETPYGDGNTAQAVVHELESFVTDHQKRV